MCKNMFIVISEKKTFFLFHQNKKSLFRFNKKHFSFFLPLVVEGLDKTIFCTFNLFNMQKYVFSSVHEHNRIRRKGILFFRRVFSGGSSRLINSTCLHRHSLL